MLAIYVCQLKFPVVVVVVVMVVIFIIKWLVCEVDFSNLVLT